MNIFKDILCPHFSVCSGCTINENANQPPILAEAHAFFEEWDVPFEYYSDKMIEWRYRAKLAVRGDPSNPQIGLYEAGSHHVVNIPLCRVHHPHINKAVERLKAWIIAHQIQPYVEVNQKGLLRYVQCAVERSTGRVQLTLVLNASNQKEIGFLLDDLWNLDPELWHSLWINWNQLRTNTIFGKEWTLAKGEPLLWETIADTTVCFHPANFAQANLDVFERLLEDLKAEIPENRRLVEYYAGVGVIGLCLSEKCKSVYCCEINPQARDSFEKAKKLSGKENVSFVDGSVVEYLDLLQEADLVIVDPPRKGIDRLLMKALLEKQPAQDLWYISCGWSSFQRDCLELSSQWKLKKAKAYLFFPGTDHLEILAHFQRKS